VNADFGGRTSMRRPLQILIVDDEPDIRISTSEVLREAGAGLVTADAVGTLRDALERVAAGVYSAALLDLTLPDARGTEAVRRFQSERPELPVVVFSGNKDADVATECMRLGAEDYVVKGDDPAELLERIRHAVVRHEVRQTFKPMDEASQELRGTLDEMKELSSRLRGVK
jgi:DNA-binding NtrC family response regulator